MSIEKFFPDPAVRQHLSVGPLAGHLDGFAQQLASKGYAETTAKQKLRLVGDISRWLDSKKIPLEALDKQHIDTFRLQRRQAGCTRCEVATCKQLLAYLHALGYLPDSPSSLESDHPGAGIEQAYRRFLIGERGLTLATVDNYLPTVHAFLTERFATEPLALKALVPQDATRFIIHYAQQLSRSRAKLMVTALRSFFRFLYQRGDITLDLAGALPPVMKWRLSGLPHLITPEQVEALLSHCDQRIPLGRRDFAILLLLARLGLRAGEVVAMTLDDFDWDAGTVTVRGKGQRHEPLPLPQEVGQALANYLQSDRPVCSTRRVFVRLRAPHCGFASSVAICNVVRRALKRAQIDPPFKGSHLLRHCLVTEMLRAGASLEDIGQILRHRHPQTTQIYAKVDLNALRALANPWPGSAL